MASKGFLLELSETLQISLMASQRPQTLHLSLAAVTEEAEVEVEGVHVLAPVPVRAALVHVPGEEDNYV